MKAVILVGGEGTRLRPLTLGTPKPIVPVVDRPFLRHQLDLLSTVGIEDIVFSVAYQPEKIQAVFGTGAALGKRIEYAVEDTPLGTGGAVKNAEKHLDDTSVVFNGDVLTDVDLPAVVAFHKRNRAAVTLVLTPVENPSAYGLVEVDTDGRVRRFVEKPKASEITTDTINAGIYVIESRTLSRMPAGVPYSIERGFFPSLLADGEPVFAHVHRGYWIDIGTPEKYLAVHRDILSGRFPVSLHGVARDGGVVHETARVLPEARLVAPFYVGPGCVVEAAEVGPSAVLVADVRVHSGASVRDSVVWAGTQLGEGSTLDGALLASRVTTGRNVIVGPGAVLGEGAVLPDFTRTR